MFTDSLKSYTSQKNERCCIIKEIHTQLVACQREKEFEVKFEISKWKAPRVLSFSLKSKVLNESVNFDVLPAFNALGETPSPRPLLLEEEAGFWGDGARRVEGKPCDLALARRSNAPKRRQEEWQQPLTPKDLFILLSQLLIPSMARTMFLIYFLLL